MQHVAEQFSSCERENVIENFVAATYRTKLNWFDFVRHVASTKLCRSDKILIITNDK